MSINSPTPLGAYTAAEVAQLAGVSSRRIGRWASDGIISASVAKRPNIYSYADAGEALLAHYLVEQGKRPGEIRAIVEHLRREYGPWPLATAPLAHDGRLVLVKRADTWISADRPQHGVMEETLLNLKNIRESLARGGWAAYKHPREHVEVDPDRHSGAPVIRGRRLPTALVAGIAADDDGRTVLRDDYGLTDAEIDDAVGYERDLTELAVA